ncbi:MAG: hypothetical protein PHU24_08805 [Sphaerochaetaceae bacterium]|nr:hypothetical protein [Sphaerochaetaceae bacterium]MDD3670384.1 hypothetical protein [Sphaerochaetaceae bacterium]MDD4258644.1 hypothetical protein [Sphaerochaetaceae bacterium]MDD4842248.1 hypothetical protein [Sphaerochaetaceae bacterium]
MPNCMIIPTYWSTPEIKSWQIFDHPTPIQEEGSLRRTLRNLQDVSYPDPIILFPAPTDPQIEKRVTQIAAEFCIEIHVCTAEDIAYIKTCLKRLGFPDAYLTTVSTNNYGAIRNIGLLYALVHGFDTVVMIDDDECIDSGYHQQAMLYMDKIYDGFTVLGKTGAVVDGSGKKYYDGQSNFILKDWPKDQLFNKSVQKEIESPGEIAPCTVAFGGNMVLSRKLFQTVPFDPFGTRGEDDDYVINARYVGIPFFFDKNLTLLHLPPKRNTGFWTRHRQDIIRFKYARAKLKALHIDPDSAGSFLAYFTQEDLDYKIISSSIAGAKYFVDHHDKCEFEEFLNNALLAATCTESNCKKNAEDFLRFLDAWTTYAPKL